MQKGLPFSAFNGPHKIYDHIYSKIELLNARLL